MKILKGICGSQKIACAPVAFYEKREEAKRKIDFDTAVVRCVQTVKRLYEKALNELGEEEAKIFSAYEMILCDKVFLQPMKQRIDAGEEEVKVITEESTRTAEILLKKDNEYLRQRGEDIKNVAKMIIEEIKGTEAACILPNGEEKFILAAENLTPADTMQFDAKRLAGIAVKRGGATSHTVILAKALGIAAVVGIKELKPMQCDTAILDGYKGIFIVNPDDETKKVYKKKLKGEKVLEKETEKIRFNETQSKDGKRIKLLLNITKPSDLEICDNVKTDGVGLFRTEFMYSSKNSEPTIEMQIAEYKKAIDKANGSIFTIRTLDVGGDKKISYLYNEAEDNPFLGKRGLRLCLENQDVFFRQLKAIAIAAAERKVKIMFPMVTSVEEVKKANELLKKACKDIGKTGENIKTGIMIETPASVFAARELAKYCDFFSIGTNDLVQYIMCADRTNAMVQENYNPFNIAVIRAIAYVIKIGKDCGVDVSICGDLAADIRFTKLFMGLGLETFSVPPLEACKIKYKVANSDMSEAKEMANKILSLESEEEIEKILESEIL